MSNYGMKISLPGYDVKIATPEQCAIHSGYPSPKIKTTASPAHFGITDYTFSSDPANGTHNLLSIAHGYSGYIPAALVFVKNYPFANDLFHQLPFVIDEVAYDAQTIIYYTNSTHLKIDYVCSNNGTGGHQDVTGFRYVFKHYLFAEEGA